jgi:hypothetical protein
LIWQESHFDPRAISHAGAQGIAQFMPATARWRGLANPFEASQALFESARWLHELWVEFGNLGLAAAAYNAGPQRVRDWINGGKMLPRETRAYVEIITGAPVATWIECASGKGLACGDAARLSAVPKTTAPATIKVRGNQEVWGLQLIGERSEEKALSEYRGLQARFPGILASRKALVLARKLPGRGSATWYQVRVAEATRESADNMCTRLKQAGGACIVLRN